jgi:hypothetical protein
MPWLHIMAIISWRFALTGEDREMATLPSRPNALHSPLTRAPSIGSIDDLCQKNQFPRLRKHR